MKRYNNYKLPIIKIFQYVDSQPIMSSNNEKYICDEYCKLWHICRDRQKLKKCFDYKFFFKIYEQIIRTYT